MIPNAEKTHHTIAKLADLDYYPELRRPAAYMGKLPEILRRQAI